MSSKLLDSQRAEDEDVEHTGNTITTVDDYSGQSSVGHLVTRPRSSECQHSLDGDVPIANDQGVLSQSIRMSRCMEAENDESSAQYSQTLDVEALEHDLGGVLTVLGSVERGLSLADNDGTRAISLLPEETVKELDQLTSKT